MAMRGMRAAWAAAAVLGCGCAMVLGVDPDKYGLVCEPGALQCKDNAVQRCGSDGLWHDQVVCTGQTCVGGACQGECEPNAAECAGNTVRSCDANGDWQSGTACTGQTCVGGACQGVCEPGAVHCAGNTPQSCDADGNWQGATACSSPMGLCFEGSCIVSPPSCDGLPVTCGPNSDESCCAMTSIPAGAFNRDNDSAYPATVSGFRLDRFEITVGRFRAFVASYPGSKPVQDAGEHPLIMGSGWAPAWDGNLPVDQAALIAAVKCNTSYQTWTDGVGANENLPMSCISWYEAFAFCAWDGGRLPTEAEWNYAAAGGNEQREYPWGGAMPDPSYAVYHCTGDGSPTGDCIFGDILQVGLKSPLGDGRWGQADLGGSMWEWNLDWYENGYASTIQCNNCTNITSGSNRVFRGGGWNDVASDLLSSGRYSYGPVDRDVNLGGRCARTP